MLGYPVNMSDPPAGFMGWRKELNEAGLNQYAFNNVGNPFGNSSFPYQTHDFESALIDNFGKLYGFPTDNIWGFLSHSGTDSNMHGMYFGKTILASRHGSNPVCFFTKEAHYSIQILSDLLGLKRVFVNTKQDASMDPDDLNKKIRANKNHPALVIATIGTTFKGAVDPIDQIGQVLSSTKSYLHLDAALFGGYLPYTKEKSMVSLQHLPSKDLRYDSIAVSCHKFFGYTSPAGLFITTRINFDTFMDSFSNVHDPEYIGHIPGTITCSRDAIKPAEFYYFAQPERYSMLSLAADDMLKNTAYLMKEMQNHFSSLEPIRFGESSNTIFFKHPGKYVVYKYTLATMHLNSEGQNLDFAHTVVMPHITRKTIDEFLSDLEESAVSL